MFNVEVDKYSDVMTIEEFADCVKAGAFIPYDGDGYFGTGSHYSYDTSVWKTFRNGPPEGATHVHWYNR